MGEEIYPGRRGRAHRVPVPGGARRERPHRAAAGSQDAVRTRRLEAEVPEDFHRRGGRRRALPGRSPAVWHRLHRRLAPGAYEVRSTPPVARMQRSEIRERPLRVANTRIALRSIRATVSQRSEQGGNAVIIIRWAILACVLAAPSAQAQQYPDRPVRLVVAFVPGGATDTLARQISQDLKEALGQSVVVENRPGANGYLAWNHVASSDPDGYTLLLAENALGISQALYKKSQSAFDPVTQYDAIAAVATSPLVLAASPKLKADSMA